MTGFDVAIKSEISDLESVMADMPQVDVPLEHYFSDGVYARMMTIGAGITFTGKIHKTLHMCVLLEGEMIVVSTTGGKDIFKAPHVFVSPPNSKRAGFAVTDCKFLNIHGTHETDLDKLEAELIAGDFVGLEDVS